MFLFHSKLCEALIISLIFLCVVNGSNYEERRVSWLFQKPRITTVLFSESFLSSDRCWTSKEIAELLSRLQLQPLLPPRMPENVPLVYHYIRLCLETTKAQLKDGNVKMAILKVMADMFGGYQQAYGLPLMKRVSYEGNAHYKTVENSFRMQEEFKDFLNTDGFKWPAPIAVKKTVTPVRELNLSIVEGDEPCMDIFLVDPRKSLNNERKTKDRSTNEKSLPIPMPIFDNDIHPNAVAIPLRDRSFCSLTTGNGFNILVDYYVRSIHCLKSLSNQWFDGKDNSLVADFDVSFRNWIMKNVLPHLHTEDVWYPGFSGVYRILITLQSKGLLNNFEIDPNLQHPQIAEENVAVKTQRKRLTPQNSHSKIFDPPEISDELVTQVTCFSSVLLFTFFLLPIMILGQRNLIFLKNYYFARFYNLNAQPRLQLAGADMKNASEKSTISSYSMIESINSDGVQYKVLTSSSTAEESSGGFRLPVGEKFDSSDDEKIVRRNDS